MQTERSQHEIVVFMRYASFAFLSLPFYFSGQHEKSSCKLTFKITANISVVRVDSER